MQLPNWMKIGEKGTLETLIIWGLPLLVILSLAFAVWGSVTDPSQQNFAGFE